MTELRDRFAGSAHVSDVGLLRARDREIWDRAAREGLVIVSKDADFRQLSFLFGPPPKVVWIRIGNCSTDVIARTLRAHAARIDAFADDPRSSFLELG